jgi:hypothetical protein
MNEYLYDLNCSAKSVVITPKVRGEVLVVEICEGNLQIDVQETEFNQYIPLHDCICGCACQIAKAGLAHGQRRAMGMGMGMGMGPNVKRAKKGMANCKHRNPRRVSQAH